MQDNTIHECRIKTSGPGGVSEPSKPTDPYDVPTAPAGVNFTKWDPQEPTLSWTKPEERGAPITGYNIQCKDGSSDEWKDGPATSGNQTNTTVPLEGRGVHQCRVKAINKAGTGTPSKPTDPYDKPTPPKHVKAALKPDQMDVKWDPSEPRGAPLEDYKVECKESTSSEWQEEASVPATQLNASITGLPDGKVHQCRVKATNKAGDSDPSEPTEIYDSSAPPDNVRITGFPDPDVDLKWDAPDDHGAPITSYEVESICGDNDDWQVVHNTADNSTNATIPDVPSEVACLFRVKAINKAGISDPSKPSEPYGVPSPPKNVKILDLSKNDFNVTWIPGEDGGAPIRNFSIDCKEKKEEDWLNRRNVTFAIRNSMIPDLNNQTIYQCHVRASNKAGTSDPSEPTKLYDKPSAPRNLEITGWENEDDVKLKWKKPLDDGGAPIMNYTIDYRQIANVSKSNAPAGAAHAPASASVSVSVEWIEGPTVTFNQTNTTVIHLEKNVRYEFAARAINRAGSSPQSNIASFDVPSPPLEIKIIETHEHSIDLEWKRPDKDGGAPIIEYVITYEHKKQEGEFVKAPPTPASNTSIQTGSVNDLDDVSQFRFRVRAFNRAGPSKPSPSTDQKGIPSMPLNLTIAGWPDDGIDLTWDDPSSDGGSPIEEFNIECMDLNHNDTDFEKVLTVSGQEHSCTVPDVHEGMRLQCRIKAETAAGASDPSDPTEPYDVPSPPSGLVIPDWPTDDDMDLAWNKSESDHGSPLMRYDIDCSALHGKHADEWKHAGESPANQTTATVKYKDGTPNKCQVKAVNRAGPSDPSDPASYDVPSPPRYLNITDPGKDISIEWMEPEYDGGSPVLKYFVQYSEKTHNETINEKDWKRGPIVPVNATNATIPSLKVPGAFVFRAFAINHAGSSNASKQTEPFGVPSEPLNVKIANFTDAGFVIAWKRPKSDGGSAITNYTIEYKNNDDEQAMEVDWKEINSTTCDCTNITLTNLPDRGVYQFRVLALNRAGSSNNSKPSDPYDRPSPPTNVKITWWDNTTFSISWREPDSDGGAPLEEYRGEYKDIDSGEWKAGPTGPANETNMTIYELKPYTTYQFRTIAVNRAGASDPSEASKTYGPPSAPQFVRISNFTGYEITWMVPDSDGGAAIEEYVVYYKLMLKSVSRYLQGRE